MAEYIDKEAAISLIKQYGHDAIDGGRYSLDTVDDCIELANRIKALPATDVAPVVHGRWEIVVGSNGKEYMVCSCCRVSQNLTGVFTYCPNCGCRMDGGAE